VISPDYPPAKGGIQILTHRVAQHFTRVDPTIITLETAGAAEFDADLPFEVIRVPTSRGPRMLDVARLNFEAFRAGLQLKPDVVLCGHIIVSPAAAAIRRCTGSPMVLYVYAKEVGARPELASFALKRASSIVAISAYTRDLALSAGANPDRIRLIPPGVDLPERAPTPRAGRDPGRRPTIVTIARLEDRYKGHDVVIRSLPLVRAKIPDVRWIVIGDGPLRPALENLTEMVGVADAVSFLGPLPDAERDAWLDQADAFVMVSRLPAGGYAGEGFGIVYLEANARGVPALAANVGGAVDAVADGQTGVLVDPTDPLVVADALIELLTDHPRSARLGAQGVERAQGFAWPEISARVEDLLMSVAQR
jgi:phosphatidylinositol alpha-1,6-mannosyltransferase